ncbi:MAG: AAA family ATPase [Patescibacteria group bacterium]|nr:AAA family ATPase [Patescibacteria group bacterium]MDE2438119.1 AAA family ATPase [Patescibacteria group bacterium]
MGHIFKFVLDGGPCGGKSTAMAFLVEKLRDYGFSTLIVPEVATLVSNAGLNISDLLRDGSRAFAFQKEVIRMQIRLEESLEHFLDMQPGDKKVLLCDRGAMSGMAYMDPKLFCAMLYDMKLHPIDLRDRRYDAVFHLVTAANGASSFYNLDNPARHDTPEEACALDERSLAAWNGHEHLRVIGNIIRDTARGLHTVTFEEKMGLLLREVTHALHIPAPLEIERKYLIAYHVNPTEFPVQVSAVPMVQTYLISPDHTMMRRVRERKYDSGVLYVYTEKHSVSSVARHEIEHIITAHEYHRLLKERDMKRRQIIKTRYSFVWENQYFQLDVIADPQPMVVMEIELTDEHTIPTLPPFIPVICDVTEDLRYSNASIATPGVCPGYTPIS